MAIQGTSSTDSGRQEQHALRLSVWGNLFFAALGLGFAFWTGSEAIQLDGFFSLIAFAMALVTVRVARRVQQGEDEDFHFGYYKLESLLNTIKGLIILGLCGLAFTSAVYSLFHGGRDISIGPALIYSLIAMAGALALAAVQGRAARQTGSPLLTVDALNWRIDGFLSLVVALAFGIAMALERSAWSHVVPFVDPGLVAVMVLALVAAPARTVWGGLAELLYAAPVRSEQAEVRERFDELLGDFPRRRVNLRMVRVGRVSYLLAHVLVSEDLKLRNLGELDQVRHRINEGFRELDPSWTVDTLFVCDESLIE